MTSQQLKAIQLYRPLLETLNESDDFGGVPESMAYIGYDGLLNVDQFQSMLNGLKSNEVIKSTRHLITKGKNFDLYMTTFKKVYLKLDAIKKETKGN